MQGGSVFFWSLAVACKVAVRQPQSRQVSVGFECFVFELFCFRTASKTTNLTQT